MTNNKTLITVGIPCYHSVSPETLDDYMRFFFYLGRRYPDYEFALAIKSKSEQFRARNSIVTAALQCGSKYIFMIDDDHVIDTAESSHEPSIRYEFLRRLINKLEESPENGIAGTLYYQRGGACKPVAMMPHPEGGYRFIRDDEISCSWQEVSVVGGGCMLIKSEIFDKIESPWFGPEFDFGTDIQICKKAAEIGYKIFLDSSQTIGHVLHKREVVTDQNRHRIIAEQYGSNPDEGISSYWKTESSIAMYVADAIDYTGKTFEELNKMAEEYNNKQMTFSQFKNHDEYYRSLGNHQIARQLVFHCLDVKVREYKRLLQLFNFQHSFYGLDFGCGSAPFSYELAANGHRVDFIDLDGAGGYEFLKWRCKKNGVKNARFEWGGPYDYVLMLDSLEHIADWQSLLDKIADSLKVGGYIVTNYFLNHDFNNVEHISMDHQAVKKYLVDKNILPANEMIWIKQEAFQNVGDHKADGILHQCEGEYCIQ